MGIEVVGLAPPLTIDTDCADQMVAILADSIAAMEADLMPYERAQRRDPSIPLLTSATEVFDQMSDGSTPPAPRASISSSSSP